MFLWVGVGIDAWQVIVESGRSLEAWHGLQNNVLRSALDSQKWLTAQVSGDSFANAADVLQKMSRPQSFEYCCIAMPLERTMVGERNEAAVEVTYQDQLSQLLGRCCLSLAAKRVSRTLWATRGWLVRFAAMLASENQRRQTADAFSHELRAFRAMESSADSSDAVQKLLNRAVFTHVAVQQFVKVVGRVCVVLVARGLAASLNRIRMSHTQTTLGQSCAMDSSGGRGNYWACAQHHHGFHKSVQPLTKLGLRRAQLHHRRHPGPPSCGARHVHRVLGVAVRRGLLQPCQELVHGEGQEEVPPP